MDDIAVARQRLLVLYEGLQRTIAEALAKEDISCKRGCCSCCRIVVNTAFIEGLSIADHVLRLPRAQRLLVTQRLRDAAIPLGTSNNAWASQEIYCGFLDRDTKDCSIYELRPAACRYHWVVSPPEDCVPGVPRKIHMLNTLELETVVHQVSKAFTGQVLFAPLPNMVLHCLVLLDPTKRKAAVGVTKPVDWTWQLLKEQPGARGKWVTDDQGI